MQFLKEILDHAKSSPTVEVCGVILRTGTTLSHVDIPNLSKTPETHYEMCFSTYKTYYDTGGVCALYHSHPASDASPSEWDEACCVATKFPMYIISIPEERVCGVRPTFYRGEHLNKREYLPLITDCGTFVQDWAFQKWGITSSSSFRSYHSGKIRAHKPQEFIESYGFRRVASDAVEDDIVLMSINGENEVNHVGIITERRMLMHRLAGPGVCQTPYGGEWKKNTVAIYRKIQ